MRYVIVGNSTAGISAAEAIRSVDEEGSIMVVSDEPYQTYSRPLITYWLSGKVDGGRMHYKGKKHLNKLGISEVLGKKVVKVDAAKKTVTLEGGEKLPYDRLLLATG